MKPVPLDEYPIHQAPLSMARVASSDRNFYDRCYFNAISTEEDQRETLLIAGAGVYPNLGVHDAVLGLRVGDRQQVVRFSDALDADRRATTHAVGDFRVEVDQPLQRLRLIVEPAPERPLGADLTFDASFPAVLEQRHLLLQGNRPQIDAQRFVQTGAWSGTIHTDGTDIAVTPETWWGNRDRSWGIRGVGEADPAGRAADEPSEGFWWLYAPIRFETFALTVIAQESPDGFRTLNDATRVFADGRVEQLGWPRIEIDYRSGSRHPERARLHLTTPSGEPLVVEVETRTFIPLHLGLGYGGDSDWGHGQWRGRDWTEFSTYDLADPEVQGRFPWGVSDHTVRATCGGETGWGLFEHGCLGRHDPSGFTDWFDQAP